jgi:hypothetical protein
MFMLELMDTLPEFEIFSGTDGKREQRGKK